MQQRGRKGLQALSLVPVAELGRAKAPEELTDDEAEIFRVVVASQPADWFTPPTASLLCQYARHVIHARHVAELLERATADKNLKASDYDRLLRMQERETRAIIWLATKMKITQQATTNYRGNKKPQATDQPWKG